MYHQSIMSRTTVDIDASVLKELKLLQAREGKTLGRLMSELLALALGQSRVASAPPKLAWAARPMNARVDLEDKEALRAVLDAR